MIIEMQRRLHECGRIRIGQQVPSKNGKTRPAKLSTFRLTSPDRVRLDAAAGLWGGTVNPWQAPAGSQWELITETDALNVVVPPSDIAFSQWYETWSAGGCQRRCDGVTETIGDRPCPCDPDKRECQIHTRLSVMLADLPGLGVWRIDTSGHYAAVELSGAVEVIRAAAGRGVLLPARLRLEQRQVKRFDAQGKPETRNFAVPVLDVQITPAQLLGGAGHIQLGGMGAQLNGSFRADDTDVRALATPGVPAIEAPRLTPVPSNTEPGPSIAEQVAPPDKPRRANAAAEIPSSGRSRRAAPNGGTPAPPRTAPPSEPATDAPGDKPAGDRMSQPQQRKLFALIREQNIDNRNDWASGLLGRDITSFGQLTQGDAAHLIDALETGNDDEAQWAADAQS